MKLYTKVGDDGKTSLVGGERVAKSGPRVNAYGTVDETNAALGAVVAGCRDAELAAILRQIQSDLLVLGSQLATPDGHAPGLMINDTQVAQLERWIDAACEEVDPFAGFVLPGGSETAAALHLARTVCRRAERLTIALSEEQHVEQAARIYLNRLSDLLYALARQANHRAGVPETPWIAPKS
ncbi:MAG: cob(I)yrinic acid a,c-diamide adenosyltransferase [Phycisphaerales bacterium]|nr:MAG: cob(I)yrinic acid a,c-diamide adenosyltransferase [Phycisphaerales bacterium]